LITLKSLGKLSQEMQAKLAQKQEAFKKSNEGGE
jgi:hypothetical protein